MINLNIRSKLFIAIFLACALAVGSGAALFHVRVQKAFSDYLRTLDEAFVENLATDLEQFYAERRDWQELSNPRLWRRILRDSGRQLRNQLPEPPEPQVTTLGQRPPRPHHTAFRITLFDAERHYLQGRQEAGPPQDLQALHFQGQTVGYLGFYPRRQFNDDSDDARFVHEQRKTLLMVALLTLITSFLIALLLSRQLVKPIHFLRRSTSELADGNYATRIQVHSQDELGQLSRDFNQLAESLQQHEKSRRQWIMDIAHELRTPLSILRGEVEAIQDGISAADPPTIQSLHQEILHLQRLVEDLYTLSMSDSGSLTYQRSEVDLGVLLSETLAQFESSFREHGLQLDSHLPDTPALMHGDPQRLQQLFQNLLKNSLRYTDAPGRLQIELALHPEHLSLRFADSAPGVPDEALPRLFERLYRVDTSRNRATGGAGIGLSICHNIVQAHGGEIHAAHSALGGLEIRINLPRA
ncbi:MAG: ATP-binding protein [Thiolinea sp.]